MEAMESQERVILSPIWFPLRCRVADFAVSGRSAPIAKRSWDVSLDCFSFC